MIRYANYQVYFQHWPPEQHGGQVAEQRKGHKDIDPKEPWLSSVYYHWWRYLSASETYRDICDTARTEDGRRSAKVLNSAYPDFGNVFEGNFWSWWWDRGWALFCEPQSYSIRKLDREGMRRWSSDLNAPDRLIVSLAVNGDHQRTVDEIKALLDELPQGNRSARGKKLSAALYQPSGKTDIPALQRYFKVWDKRRTDPDLEIYEITHKCGIEKTHMPTDDNWRKQASNDFYRLFNKADAIIKNAAYGVFPVTEELSMDAIAKIRRGQMALSRDRRSEIDARLFPNPFGQLKEYWAGAQITSGSLAQLNL